MIRTARYSFVALIGLLLACLPAFAQTDAASFAKFSYKRTDSLSMVRCTVQKIVDSYTLVPIDQPNRRYSTTNLSERYQVEGLKLVVSGVVGAPPPNVRMLATPFFVTFAQTEMPTDRSLGGSGATPTQHADGIMVQEQTATVRKIGNDYIVQLADGTKFAPQKLKRKYRKEGAKVVITGTAQPIPAESRQSFYPIKLSNIKKAQ